VIGGHPGRQLTLLSISGCEIGYFHAAATHRFGKQFAHIRCQLIQDFVAHEWLLSNAISTIKNLPAPFIGHFGFHGKDSSALEKEASRSAKFSNVFSR